MNSPDPSQLPVQSRLLKRAQEIGRLEDIINLFIENQIPVALMLLTGMQSNGRSRVLKVELDAAQNEVAEITEQLFIEQAALIQPLLFLPEYFQEPTYIQAQQMLKEGAPDSPIRAMLAGWFMTLEHPYPHVRARILAHSIKQMLSPDRAASETTFQLFPVKPDGHDDLPRLPNEQDVPMYTVKGRLSKHNREAVDRLLQIFPDITCLAGETDQGKRYIFRAEYAGRRAQTEALVSIPDNTVAILIDLTSALMQAEHQPVTLN